MASKTELMVSSPPRARMTRIPPALIRERRLVMGLKNDPRADIFRILRTNVLRRMRENGWTSLAVTSPNTGNGKSFVTANLGIALAMEANQTVLAVDADLRRPRLGWYFGLDQQAGLLDYLNDGLSLENILVNPGIDRLVVLPGRGTASHSSEWLSSPRMLHLVGALKTWYASQIILFDMPPLLGSDDTLMFMPHFDAALLVVEDGKNNEEEISRSLQILEGTDLIGMVLNKAQKADIHNYYGWPVRGVRGGGALAPPKR